MDENLGLDVFQKHIHDLIMKLSHVKGAEQHSIKKIIYLAEALKNVKTFKQHLAFLEHLPRDHIIYKRTAINTLLRFVSHQFNVESCRAAQKHREAQTLSIAIFYESLWPFINCSQLIKDKEKKIKLSIPQGTTYVDIKGLPFRFSEEKTYIINFSNYRDFVEIKERNSEIYEPIIYDDSSYDDLSCYNIDTPALIQNDDNPENFSLFECFDCDI